MYESFETQPMIIVVAMEARSPLLALILVLQVCTPCLSFNLDLRYPHIYHGPRPGEYFGYTVALNPGSSRPGDYPWLQIGAPRANDSREHQFREQGLVYQCPISSVCSSLKLDYTKLQRYEKKDGSMIGGAQDVLNGRMVACGPRYLDQSRDDEYAMFGVCYGSDTAQSREVTDKLIPLEGRETRTIGIEVPSLRYPYKTTNYQPYYVFGEAGFSAHFPNITRGPKEVLLGAPGIFNWKGSAVLYRDGDSGLNIERRRRRSGRLEDFVDKLIPNPYDTPDIKGFAYFGYAVSSGRYYSSYKLLYASGAPRNSNKGSVFIFEFPSLYGTAMLIRDTRHGTQYGEYFGASLATGDINNDGYDDLLVGSPLYSTDMDEGRVSVFFGSRSTKLVIPMTSHVLSGLTAGGRFGSAISCLGDLDNDGYADFAVGAPYEGDGVVYIYKGNMDGLKSIYSQRIMAEQIAPGARGFGFSLSRGQDVDQNGYNDIAIGAYSSDHAILLRSRPVVEFIVGIFPQPSRLNRNSTRFNAKICIEVSGYRVPPEIKVFVTLEVDPKFKRASLDKRRPRPSVDSKVYTEELTIPTNRESCSTMNFHLNSMITNFIDPISLSVTYDLLQEENLLSPVNFRGGEAQGRDQFCKTCPILSLDCEKSKTIEVPFSLECGDDNICSSELSITASFENLAPDATFTIGSAPSLHLLLVVSNHGDPAYLARAEISLPVPIVQIPAQCQVLQTDFNGTTLLRCELDNPLPRDGTRKLNLELDMGTVRGQGTLMVHAKPVTSSQDRNAEGDRNVLSLPLILTSVADITVSGKASSDRFLFDQDEDKSKPKQNISFAIRYQVEKFEASPLEEVWLQILLPFALKDSGNLKRFLHLTSLNMMIGQQPQVCTADSRSVPEVSERVQSRRRRRRRSEVTSADKDLAVSSEAPLSNLTLYVNCSGGDGQESKWECMRVTCSAGPFPNNLAVAKLNLAMLLDISVLEPLLGVKNIVYFSTVASVEIKRPNVKQPHPHRPDYATVSATFLGKVREGKVETWIILLSIIAGILLLLVVVSGLIKAGFFERKQKDALIKLKRETQMIAQLKEYENPSPISDSG